MENTIIITARVIKDNRGVSNNRGRHRRPERGPCRAVRGGCRSASPGAGISRDQGEMSFPGPSGAVLFAKFKRWPAISSSPEARQQELP